MSQDWSPQPNWPIAFVAVYKNSQTPSHARPPVSKISIQRADSWRTKVHPFEHGEMGQRHRCKRGKQHHREDEAERGDGGHSQLRTAQSLQPLPANGRSGRHGGNPPGSLQRGAQRRINAFKYLWRMHDKDSVADNRELIGRVGGVGDGSAAKNGSVTSQQIKPSDDGHNSPPFRAAARLQRTCDEHARQDDSTAKLQARAACL